jgi:transposase
MSKWYKPKEFKIVILDNGSFHKSAGLKVPANMSLLFLPPYCPELNPAELIWRWLKNKLGNKVYATLDVLSEALGEIVKQLTPEMIRSITGWKIYINTTILNV